MGIQSLSNMQLELLKIYSTNLSPKDLRELKKILAGFFAQKAIKQADRIWDEQKLTNEDMNKWLDEWKG